MTMRRILLALCAVVALAAVRCASSNSGSTSSRWSSGASAAAASSSGGGVTIKMQDIAFDPKAVTVKVGQKVTWTNEDTVDHNVTSQSGETIKSDNFGKGGTFSFTPKKAGKISYVCTIHPGMTATLTVTG